MENWWGSLKYWEQVLIFVAFAVEIFLIYARLEKLAVGFLALLILYFGGFFHYLVGHESYTIDWRESSGSDYSVGR